MKAARIISTLGIVALCFVSVASCTLFVGDLNDLVPIPGDVRILPLPSIISCSARPIRTYCVDRYERDCDWYYLEEPGVQTPAGAWVYACPDVWKGTDCWYDIVVRLTVCDPSNGFRPGNLPRIRVFNSNSVPGEAGHGDCFLDVDSTDLAVLSTEATASEHTKIVTVRLEDVLVAFSNACRTFRANLRFAIVLEVDGQDFLCPNVCESTAVLSRQP